MIVTDELTRGRRETKVSLMSVAVIVNTTDKVTDTPNSIVTSITDIKKKIEWIHRPVGFTEPEHYRTSHLAERKREGTTEIIYTG